MATALALPNGQSEAAKKSLVADRPTHILHRTPWRPPVATKAEGLRVTLEDGTTLIDAAGGAAVVSVGHGHPKVIQAIKDQADKVCYVYNMQLSNEPAEELADFIIDESDGAFELCGFVSGGSEAMEGTIKLARQYFWEIGEKQRTNFIARNLSFHGNTVATLNLAYHPTRRAPYAGIMDDTHFHHVSPAYAARFQKAEETEEQYVERLRQELENKFIELGPETVAGFCAETVVGATTGCVPPPKGYLKAMKSVCEKYGALFILDEVMSGMGRMGSYHAWQTYGPDSPPDIQAVAKGLGGGYAAIGAVLMSAKVAKAIVCAASLAVQKVFKEEKLIDNCKAQGDYLGELLQKKLGPGSSSPAAPFVFDIRGGGLFWATEFDLTVPGAANLDFKGQAFALAVQARCLENGLILMGLTGGANLEGTKGDHVMICPPYTVTKEDVDEIVKLYVQSVEEVLKEAGL
ncbi:pyridoxal phosphate-dependent transferase [Schizophyllum amplum]|uniref:Pyridoxal phosphate-dependent transferase n=1 Tax=Schizophyllum amplum TaxID=97359 RepID=A0A550CL42_9AGAR|nr:pyridoxal phosphate-dependent transferase [Auriculariopsis ampla]